MNHYKHCEHTLKELGETFDYVHRWLDEFSHTVDEDGRVSFHMYHRKYRHHLAGAEEVRQKWGDKAYEAAILHIRDDLVSGGGLRPNESIPLDEKDYVKKGFF